MIDKSGAEFSVAFQCDRCAVVRIPHHQIGRTVNRVDDPPARRPTIWGAAAGLTVFGPGGAAGEEAGKRSRKARADE